MNVFWSKRFRYSRKSWWNNSSTTPFAVSDKKTLFEFPEYLKNGDIFYQVNAMRLW